MPTLRGVCVAILGVGLWVAGRLFGSPPLEHVGFALLGLVVLAIAVVRLSKHDLHVDRRVIPPRARVGQKVTIEISLQNRGWGTAPLVLLRDRLPPDFGGDARFALQGVEPDGERTATAEVSPARRGRFAIGPLTTEFVDPFGLARVTSVAASQDSLLVHPRIEILAMPRDRSRQRAHSLSALRQLTGARGEDFYTMREYVEGDDLRKIHWPSTAKRDHPMIRQEETSWHTRATVVLDDRIGVHDEGAESSFERAVEGAASLIDLYHRVHYSFRLVTARGARTGNARGDDHLHRCLDLLAEVTAQPSDGDVDPLQRCLAELEAGSGAEGSLWLITGSLGAETVAAITHGTRRYRHVGVVAFPAHRFGGADTKSRWAGESTTREALRLLTRAGVVAVVVGPHESLASAWGTTVARRVRGGGAAWEPKPELV